MSLEDDIITLVTEYYPIEQVYKDAIIMDYVRSNFGPGDAFEINDYSPDELFSNKKLEEWALANGFVKE